MPCNSEYMNPNKREAELQKTAQLLLYVNKKLGIKSIKSISRLEKAANNKYCTDDYVADLCATIRAMKKYERDAIVYNAKDRTSRALANWWEEHQRADREREAKEAAAKKTAATRRKAIAKLTPAERKALKISDTAKPPVAKKVFKGFKGK